MEIKNKYDYFILEDTDNKHLHPAFLAFRNSMDGKYLVCKLSSNNASLVEDVRDHLLVYNPTYFHIEAKDSASFLVNCRATENPITTYLGRAKLEGNSIAFGDVKVSWTEV